jgi:hypothetical protein
VQLGRLGLGEEAPVAVHRPRLLGRERVRGREPALLDELQQRVDLRVQQVAIRVGAHQFTAKQYSRPSPPVDASPS